MNADEHGFQLGAGLLPAQAPPEPITIDQAVQEALANNANLIAERMNVPLATARLVTAHLRPNPVLTLDGDYLDVLGTGFSPANGAGPTEAAGRVDFVLEGPGKRAGRIAVVELDKSAAELSVLNAIWTVMFDVQSAFVDVQLAKEALALAEQNLNDLDKLVEESRKRVRASCHRPTFCARASRRCNSAMTRRMRLPPALDAASARADHGPLDVCPCLTSRVRYGGTRSLSRFSRYARRPSNCGPTFSHWSVPRRVRRPISSFNLRRAKSTTPLELKIHRQQSVNGTGNSPGIFLSVPLPVFNRNQGEIERARLEYRQLEARLSALRASVAAEVESSYEQYAIAGTMLSNLETDMLEQSRDVRRAAEESYRAGTIKLLEFLDARRAYTDTMQSYNDTRAGYARSLYSMESVSGKSVAGRERQAYNEDTMGFEQYHEPASELSQKTRTFARMIASLIEEAEAISWYEQRISVEKDKTARAIMRNAQKEEFKHFGMNLEFLLRQKPDWRTVLQDILFKPGDIVEHGEEAEKDVD